MKLTRSRINDYHEQGFLLVKNVFDAATVTDMIGEMQSVIQEDCPRRILEKSGAVRSFFAPEQTSRLFKGVVNDKRLWQPASQLLNDQVYVHQTKLNTKHAMIGDWWDWHQDFVFWHKDDGMPGPDVLTAMIFLSDMTEFNGPMLLIPGSHREGIARPLDKAGGNGAGGKEGWYQEYQQSKTYMSALTADLKYTLGQENVRRWADTRGIVSAKAPAGSVLFFHGNIFHASSNNLSPWDRHAFLITYNSVSNKLEEISNPRPEFIASRNYTPLN